MPWQHRLYDVIVAGCIPVVVESNISGCLDHFTHKRDLPVRNTSNVRVVSYDTCSYLTYPFYDTIDWKNIFLSIPYDIFESEQAGKFLLSITKEELSVRHAYIAKIRKVFIYDWEGKSKDAFSMTLNDICKQMLL